jgi:hypothetical protein
MCACKPNVMARFISDEVVLDFGSDWDECELLHSEN